MIGKSSWFKRRKYGGWGLTPSSWQGWLYILAFAIPITIINSIPQINPELKFNITISLVFLILLDVMDIMRNLKKDEREKIHEAISERNAVYAMIVVLLIELFYKIFTTGIINYWILATLLAGALIKSISNYRLDKKD